MSDRERNVTVNVELQIHVPGAKADGVSVDDETYEAVERAVVDAFEAGDSQDLLNAILIVQSAYLIEHGEAS